MTSQFQAPLQLLTISQEHPYRSMIEAYVTQRYQCAFDAQLETFMPVYLALFQQQQLVSVCGIRCAADEPLFLEQYLDAPAETLIASALGETVAREQLIEFGQLASFSSGFSRAHFYLMARQLLTMGYRSCIFTATGPLLALMQRMRLKPQILAAAHADAVANPQQWGDYYQHRPQVMGGLLAQGVQYLYPESPIASLREVQ
ncbi:thermostable hemolysin [Celerinatantimonas sp. YJH-8]|uniref:thermostable hemolysin n=1 Tax=Celerinatantimonas sp. YJH-8 TaxID=3228714 RepID=UPI0038CA0614